MCEKHTTGQCLIPRAPVSVSFPQCLALPLSLRAKNKALVLKRESDRCLAPPTKATAQPNQQGLSTK